VLGRRALSLLQPAGQLELLLPVPHRKRLFASCFHWQVDCPLFIDFHGSSKSPMDRLATILSTLNHLDLGDQIVQRESIQAGIGGTCDVFTAWSTKQNSKVAVKRIRVFLRKDEKLAKKIAREIRIWTALDHECVLPFLGYFVEYGNRTRCSPCGWKMGRWMNS